jgi:hypothetical protein
VTSPGSPVANVSVSTGEYVSEPLVRSAVSLQLAATSGYDLRPLGDDFADYGLGDDLLVDILAESSLAVR